MDGQTDRQMDNLVHNLERNKFVFTSESIILETRKRL